jgi:hypothetical protein
MNTLDNLVNEANKHNDMKNFRTWFPIVSTGLAVFLMVLWLTGSCDKPTTKPSDNELWRQKVASLTATIDEKDSIIATLRKNRIVDEVKFLQSEAALKGQIKAKDKTLAQARQDIAIIRTQSPQVETFVIKADSAIAVRDSLINAIGMRMRAAEYSYKEELRLMGERNVVQVQISQLLETKVTDLTNQNAKLAKKLENKKRGNRLLLGIAGGLAGAIAILTLSQ